MTSDTAGGAEKLPPIHPGDILEEEFLRPMKISRYRLAKSIGVDPRRADDIANGERGISAETALLFSRFFGNSAGFWMGAARTVRFGGGVGAGGETEGRGRSTTTTEAAASTSSARTGMRGR